MLRLRMNQCTHCNEPLEMDLTKDPVHLKEHHGLCCDCFDLSWGMSLDSINKERAVKGKPPLTKPWSK